MRDDTGYGHGNSSVPLSVIDDLVHDTDFRNRFAIARITDAPVRLRRLAADRHGRVRRAASEPVCAGPN
jgi:hypothetical protein